LIFYYLPNNFPLLFSYLLPAKIGDEIIVEGKCLKIGRMMAFTEATFIRKRDGVMVAKGRHNMFMLRPKQVPDSGQH
jgi:acyl-coenzyme A thioesterase PaaI-like protein